MSVPGMLLDPLRAYNFVVTVVDSSSQLKTAVSIGSIALGGFTECSGLEFNMQPEEYREGGRNDATLKFPSRTTWSNLRLRKGVGITDELWNWHYNFTRGRGKRRDGLVVLLNELRMPAKVWIFRRGLPVRWTGPALNAAQSEIAIEELEIAHEGLELASVGTAIGSALGS